MGFVKAEIFCEENSFKPDTRQCLATMGLLRKAEMCALSAPSQQMLAQSIQLPVLYTLFSLLHTRPMKSSSRLKSAPTQTLPRPVDRPLRARS